MALPTIFTPAATDQSLTYLYGIFGSMNGVISSPSGATASTLLGTMFEKFNSIMLAVGVLIVVYVTVVGIMNTAHEGQFMGKNWNNLWIPIRTVLGIAALVPTGSGYSGLQIIMMWVIVQGIGAADTLWTTAIGYYSEVGSIYARVGVPTLEVKDSMKGLFQGLVCAKSAAQTWADPVPGSDVKYFCAKNPTDSFCRNLNSNTFAPLLDNPKQTQYALGPNDSCGVLNYCNVEKSCAVGQEDSLACKTCKTQITVLKDAIPTLAGAADKYIRMDYDYMGYWSATRKLAALAKETNTPPGKLPKPSPPAFVKAFCDADNNAACLDVPSPIGDLMSAPYSVVNKMYWEKGLKPDLGSTYENFINFVVSKYSLQINDVVTQYMDELKAKSAKTLSGPLKKANDDGWIVAGSYYFVISQGNANNIAAMMPTLTFENTKIPTSDTSTMYQYRNGYNASESLICLSQNGTNCGSLTGQVMKGPANGTEDAIRIYKAGLEDTNADPLAGIMATGNMYLIIAEIIFWVFFTVLLIIGIGAMVSSFMVLGSGVSQGGWPIAFEITMIFTPIVMILLTFLIGIGATLAVYVPLIPFMIFTLGAIGWMISTVEAMVAGPLVALGIISPSGHHEVMGKAEPALGLLFSIFLRPTLMIFGMFAAMLLSAQVMKMANAGFATVLATSNIASGGMFKAIIIMATNVAFIVAVLNKTFSVIYIIPERVLSWINIQVLHEGAELGELKAGVEKGAQSAGEMGRGTMDTASGTGKAAGGIRAEKRAQAQDKKGADIKQGGPPPPPEDGG